MIRNKSIILALVLSVTILATTVIFLEETISVSDEMETSNTETVIQSEPIYGTSPSGEPHFGDVTISISHLPNIGETAVVTVTNNDLKLERGLGKNLVELRIHLPSNLEFVDLEPTSTYVGTKYDGSSYVTAVDITGKDSISLSATIRVVGEGNAKIIVSSGNVMNTPEYLFMVLSENTRLGHDFTLRGQSAPPIDFESMQTFTPEQLGMDEVSFCLSRHITDPPFENEESLPCVTITAPLTEEQLRHEEQMHRNDTETIPQNYEGGQNSHTSLAYITGTLQTQLEFIGIGPPPSTSVFDVRVCLLEYDVVRQSFSRLNSPTQGIGNYCTYTDENGQYQFNDIPNYDPNGDGSTLDVSVIFTSEGNHSSVKDQTNSLYQHVTPVSMDISSSQSIVIDASLTPTNPIFQESLWIKDGIGDTWIFFDNLGTIIPFVNVNWQSDDATDIFGITDSRGNTATGAFYLSNNNIYLDGATRDDDGDQDQRWTIIHEYGHHVMNKVDSGWSSSQCGLTGHDMPDESNLTCAWGEGWPDILPSFVDNKSRYIVESGTNIGWDFEQSGVFVVGVTSLNSHFAPHSTHQPNVLGETVEGRVASALWDIYDDNDHTADNSQDGVSHPISSMWTAFQVQNTDTFEEYITNWNNIQSNPSVDSILRLHSMSFAPALPVVPTNTTPVASSHSTVSVSHNTATSIILSGTDADGDSLDFYITSNPSKGTLSHSSTRTVIPGDNGSSVTITYTPSNGQTGSDSFTFKVNDGTADSSSKTVRLSIANAPVVIPPTGSAIFSDDFEGTLSNWTLTGDDEDWELKRGSQTGTTGYVASSDDCDRNCYMISDTINARQAVTLGFDRYVSTSIDRNEGLKVEVSTNNGRTWSELEFYTTSPRSDDSTWHNEELDISSYQSSTFKLKFIGISSSRSEIVQIDNVVITGSSSGGVTPPTSSTSFDENFDDLTNWSKSGDNRWTVVSSWYEDLPTNRGNFISSKNCDNSCILTSGTIDLSSYSSATLEVSRFVDSSLDSGEYLSIEVYNGNTWTEIAKWGADNNQDTDEWEDESINISRYIDDNFKIKITSLQSSNSEDTGIDYIRITS